jgi:hypothetical protein
VTQELWFRVWGFGLACVGAYWCRTAVIGVGIEGRAPSFYIRGSTARVTGAVIIVLGLSVAAGLWSKWF